MLPLVEIGFLYAGDPGDSRDEWDAAREALRRSLATQFPSFRWETPAVERLLLFDPDGRIDPLVLAETVLQEKITQHWDYAVAVVPNELHARAQNFMLGAPSSALEIAVVGARRLGTGERLTRSLTALCLHLVGHLWGLPHQQEGPMLPPGRPRDLVPAAFSDEERDRINDRLHEVADARLEESPAPARKRRANSAALPFYAKTFYADPKGILADVAGYAPWNLPFRLRRMTGAAAAPTLLLLLGAEAWEIGSKLPAPGLAALALFTTGGAATFMYLGQRLNLVSRELARTEQVARSQIVLFLSLLAGVGALFVILLLTLLAATAAAPQEVVEAWAGGRFGWPEKLRLATFMASVGVSAGALGGTLEETAEIKYHLFLDEET